MQLLQLPAPNSLLAVCFCQMCDVQCMKPCPLPPCSKYAGDRGLQAQHNKTSFGPWQRAHTVQLTCTSLTQ